VWDVLNTFCIVLKIGRLKSCFSISCRATFCSGKIIGIAIRNFNKEISIVIYSADTESPEPIFETHESKIGDFVKLKKNTNMDRLQRALQEGCLKYEENRVLRPDERKKEAKEFLSQYDLVGQSRGMVEVGNGINLARKTDCHVLTLGETGSGKEVVANAIHNKSKKNFLALNCGALNTNTLASELFGHEKGAYTGAHQRKIGIFEAAQGGTVFLDEIDKMPIASQNYLLRVIEEKKVRRMGGTGEEYSVNFRLIAAAKPGIRDLIKKELFLADLYFRLKHLVISIPPLRDKPIL